MRGGQGRLYRGVCILLGLGLLTFGGWQAAGQPGIAVLETQVTRVKQAAQYLSVPLPTATATATPTATAMPTATPAATPAAAIGLDSSALDAFCAAQAGSFSVYVKDLSSGEEYFFGTDAEYYPASILKAAYALWLCEMGEAGLVDLSGAVYNFYGEELASGALAGYAASETIPVWDALYTMIAQSDNQAVRLLAAVWPGNAETGFSAFLWELGFHAADSCAITMEEGIEGVMSIEDAGILMNALYEYFDTDTELARQLRACFLDALSVKTASAGINHPSHTCRHRICHRNPCRICPHPRQTDAPGNLPRFPDSSPPGLPQSPWSGRCCPSGHPSDH